jgi:hypothetical protein
VAVNLRPDTLSEYFRQDAMHAAEPTFVDTDSLKRRPLPAHPPTLYTVAAVAEPITVGEAISETSLARYREHGWLAVKDVWSNATVATSAGLLDDLAAGREAAAAERQLEAMAGDEPAPGSAATSRVRKLGFSVMLAAETGLPVGERGLLPHGTPTNLSESRRRAVQLHFCPAGSRRVSKAERFSTFGDRGRFTC